MKDHATLSHSKAKQWLTCTPSIRTAEKEAESKASSYADEGNVAHDLGEIRILWQLRMISEKMYNYKLSLLKKKKNKYFNQSMWDYVSGYVAFVIKRYNALRKIRPHAMIFVETKVDTSPWVPEGFGTADVILIADDYLEFIDLKYGQGVAVYAKENPQLMLYALGAYNLFGWIFEPNHCSLVIYQPRIDNISTYQTDYLALLKWAENVVVPQARKAFDGVGEFVPGDHCQFCAVKATCRVNAKYRLEISGAFKEPALLTDEEVVEVLGKYEGLVNWAGAIADYALQKAVNGKDWPGYKLVSARSNRVYKDAEKVIQVLKKAGYKDADILDSKLKGIGGLETLLGVKDFEKLIGKLVIKPYGKPALAPKDDARPAYDRTRVAKEVWNIK